jgi:hypothetical protein
MDSMEWVLGHPGLWGSPLITSYYIGLGSLKYPGHLGITAGLASAEALCRDPQI